jgi:hypothetical protein
LLSEAPDGVISNGKKVLRLQKPERSVNGGGAEIRLHFEDGSTEYADLVVAADGLYSVSFPLPFIRCLEERTGREVCLN